jgi:hypothetical protein
VTGTVFARLVPVQLSLADRVFRGCRDALGRAENYSSFAQAWRRHAHILPSLVISFAVCAWFVTWGDLNFFLQESFCRFYDAQALSLLHGRLDVPPQAIGFEAFVFENKYYGYFGIAPAVLRIPFVLLLGDLNGLASRSMIFMACCTNLICAYGILFAVRSPRAELTPNIRVLHSLFIICAGVGSTNIYLMSRSFVFHEAIMWASAFALASTWSLIRYQQTSNLRFLLIASGFAIFSFHSRPTSGFGAVLALAIVALIVFSRVFGFRKEAQLEHGFIALMAVCVAIGTYCLVNYAKFRTFDGIPLRYYQLHMQNPERMRITGAKQLHLANISTTLVNYFGWRGFEVKADFPWLYMIHEATVIGRPAIDVVEPFSSVPVSMPALALLAGVGAVSVFHRSSEVACAARLPAATLWIGGAVVLLTVGITERYLHDFYPALILCAALGIARIETWRIRTPIIVGIAILSVASVALNCAFAIVHQRAAPWGVPVAKRAQFIDWQKSMRFR